MGRKTEKGGKDRKKGENLKWRNGREGGGRIRDWKMEFKMINVVVFRNHKKKCACIVCQRAKRAVACAGRRALRRS